MPNLGVSTPKIQPHEVGKDQLLPTFQAVLCDCLGLLQPFALLEPSQIAPTISHGSPIQQEQSILFGRGVAQEGHLVTKPAVSSGTQKNMEKNQTSAHFGPKSSQGRNMKSIFTKKKLRNQT